MKTNTVFVALIIFMISIFITSCGEASKKDAQHVKEDLEELNKDLKQGAQNTSEELKTRVTAEWEQFKIASEKTIQNTENEIKNLRDKIKKTNKKEIEMLNIELDKLEQKNIILKDKLAVRTKNFKENLIEFNEESKEAQQAFEREFSRDMDALENAIENLFKNNVD